MTNENRVNQTLVLALLRSAQLFHRAIGPTFKTAGLTSAQWDVMETLNKKGPCSINDLLELILATSGNLDVVIKNLIQMGFVEKTVDERDRRARVVRLTPEGKKAVDGFFPVHDKSLSQIFGQLTNTDKRALISKLNQFRKKLRQPQRRVIHE